MSPLLKIRQIIADRPSGGSIDVEKHHRSACLRVRVIRVDVSGGHEKIVAQFSSSHNDIGRVMVPYRCHPSGETVVRLLLWQYCRVDFKFMLG